MSSAIANERIQSRGAIAYCRQGRISFTCKLGLTTELYVSSILSHKVGDGTSLPIHRLTRQQGVKVAHNLNAIPRLDRKSDTITLVSIYQTMLV